ncbi:MAG: penicillin-binding protein activator [Alphaproteobacteria bacterium]|nr:penicillin-binding protein activator [Alphaproteobacteria bacterium]
MLLLTTLAACGGTPEEPPSAERRPPAAAAGDMPRLKMPPRHAMPKERHLASPTAPATRGQAAVAPEAAPASPPAYRKVKVALLVPQTGNSADLGRAMLDAAQLALYDKYASLNPAQKQAADVILLPKDTRATASEAADAARQAIDEGADLILGPVFSTALAAVAPLAREKQVEVISFSNDKTSAGDGVFVMGFTPEDQVDRILRYAARQGAHRFAALLPSDAYGTAVARAVQKSVADIGGEVAGVGYYSPNAPELYAEIRALFGITDAPSAAAKGDGAWQSTDPNRSAAPRTFDAVLIPEGGARLQAVAEAFAAYGIDPHEVMVLGSGQWDDRANPPPAALSGAWFVSAAPAQRDVFTRHFEKSYGYKPPRLASLAYDAMALASTLAFDPAGRSFSPETLTDPSGFNGPVDGIFRFTPDGQCQRGLAVIEFSPQGFSVIDPPAEYF